MLRDAAPVSYQTIAGKRVPVSSRYVLERRRQGAALRVRRGAPTERDRELVIDPGMQFTTFLGGAATRSAPASPSTPAATRTSAARRSRPTSRPPPGAFKRTGAASNFADAFVTKLNPAGTALVYSTFVGGSDMEFGNGIAIDAAGNAYVTGTTKSSNFPTTAGAFDRTLNIPANCPRCGIDNTDGFVFKLNADAARRSTYSTYLGGTDIDSPRGIAVDAAGSAYVVGETLSSDFPTTAGAFRRTSAGDYDMFVTKLNPAGSALAYSTFLGGTQVDNGQGIAVDAGGNAYVAGLRRARPTSRPRAGAFDTTANGGFDATVTKLNPAGSALVYSTYLGGQDFDGGSDVAVDGAGNAYVAGGTSSTDFPTTPGAFDTTPDGSDGFVTKLNPAGLGAGLLHRDRRQRERLGDRHRARPGAATPGWRAARPPPTSRSPPTPPTPRSTAAATRSSPSSTPPARPCPTRRSSAARSPRARADIGARLGRQPLRHRQHVLEDFPATAGAFDTVWNGDPTIFWGDAFVDEAVAHGWHHAARAAAGPGRTDAAGAGQRCQPGAAGRRSTGAT